MRLVTAEPFSSHLTLSTKLVSEMGGRRSTMRATTDRSGHAVIISAGGEVDAYNEDTWRHLVAEAAKQVNPPGPLVIDVSSLDFMGCCAFSVLAEEAERCRDRSIDLRLVSHQPVLARIVQACGLRQQLPVYPTTESALASTRC